MLLFNREDAYIWVIDVGSPRSEFLVSPEEYPAVKTFVISNKKESVLMITFLMFL